MKGRAAVGKYYLESLLEYVVRQGSSNQNHTFLDPMTGLATAAPGSPMTLARFMAEIVNAQDKLGDTALNLAARTSTTTIIDQLIEVGADPHIGNRGGLAPVDFGVGGYGSSQMTNHDISMFSAEAVPASVLPQKSFEEAQEGLLSCKYDTCC
jgi:ankyrin repeat protein